jgi:hypothetical protein
MQKPASSRKRTQIALLIAVIAITAFILEGCREQAPVASAPVAVPAAAPVAATASARTREQAMNALMALPELKAWSARLEKESGGKVRGALIEYDSTPKLIDGKAYWQFSFVENGSDAAHRWESFLVSQSGDEIMVDDDISGKAISLEQWRREEKPMERQSPGT